MEGIVICSWQICWGIKLKSPPDIADCWGRGRGLLWRTHQTSLNVEEEEEGCYEEKVRILICWNKVSQDLKACEQIFQDRMWGEIFKDRLKMKISRTTFTPKKITRIKFYFLAPQWISMKWLLPNCVCFTEKILKITRIWQALLPHRTSRKYIKFMTVNVNNKK